MNNTSKERDNEYIKISLMIKSEKGTQKKLTKLSEKSKLSKVKRTLELDTEYKFLDANDAEVDEDRFNLGEFLSNRKDPVLNINKAEKMIKEQLPQQPRKRKEAAKVRSSNDISKSKTDYWDLTQLPLEQVKLLLKNSKYNYGYTPTIGYARKPIFEDTWHLLSSDHIYNNYPAKTECFWESSKKNAETIKFVHHEVLAKMTDYRIAIDGSLKRSREDQRRKTSQEEYFYAESLIPKGSYNLTDLCVEKLPAFENFFERDENNEWIITEEKIKEFIQDYGLFFPTEVIFGGKRFIEETFSRTGNFEGKKKSIEAQAKAALGMTGAGVRSGNNKDQADTSVNHSRKLVVQSLGGLPEKQENPEGWLAALINNPQSCTVIKMTGLRFTYELLNKELKDKIQFYLENSPEGGSKIEDRRSKIPSFLKKTKKKDVDSYSEEVLSTSQPIENYKKENLTSGAMKISYILSPERNHVRCPLSILGIVAAFLARIFSTGTPSKVIVYFDRDGNRCQSEREAIEKSKNLQAEMLIRE